MATWDDSESPEGDFEEEQANMALMESTEASDFDSGLESGSESESYFNEVLYNLTRSEVEFCLTEILENY